MRKLPASPALERAYNFSVRVVKRCQQIKAEQREFDLTRQLIRSATSVGANLAEAGAGYSRADFTAKIGIAYKEAVETKYWLNLLYDLDLLPEAEFYSLLDECDEICAMLFASMKKARR